MNKAQRSMQNMGKGTLDVLLDNSGLWNGKVAITQKVEQVEQNLAAIALLDSLSTPNTNGYTTQKNEMKELMSEAAYMVATPLLIFARAKKNSVLASEIDYSYSDLIHVQDRVSRNRSQLVTDRAQTNLAELNDYDVTAEQLTALQQLITNFDDLLALPRAMRKNQQNLRKDLQAAFKALSLLLNDLDGLMLQYTKIDPAFYQAYDNARHTEREVSHTVSIRGHVTDSVTGSPLPKTDIEVVELHKKVTSSARGTYQFLSLPLGTYSLRISRTGYHTQTISYVAVLEGRMNRQHIALVKA